LSCGHEIFNYLTEEAVSVGRTKEIHPSLFPPNIYLLNIYNSENFNIKGILICPSPPSISVRLA
jgi:hypothetical protein